MLSHTDRSTTHNEHVHVLDLWLCGVHSDHCRLSTSLVSGQAILTGIKIRIVDADAATAYASFSQGNDKGSVEPIITWWSDNVKDMPASRM
jgi:hypothetical protein